MDAIAIIQLATAALTAYQQSMAALQSKKERKEMTKEEEDAYDTLVTREMQGPVWKKSTG